MPPIFFRKNRVWTLFFLVLFLNAGFWWHSNSLRARWTNVPPTPSSLGASSMALGDTQFSYRGIGLMLQNFADTGGRTTPLKEYDYPALSRWFFLEDSLDPVSNYIPMLAAFYFGGTTDPFQASRVVDYLEIVGRRSYAEKWRWMAQAVYLARHVMEDKGRALELAKQLSENRAPHMPAWTRTMPALILNEQGSKEMAYNIMTGILKEGADTLDPAEVIYVRDYICDDILSKDQAAAHPLCRNR